MIIGTLFLDLAVYVAVTPALNLSMGNQTIEAIFNDVGVDTDTHKPIYN